MAYPDKNSPTTPDELRILQHISDKLFSSSNPEGNISCDQLKALRASLLEQNAADQVLLNQLRSSRLIIEKALSSEATPEKVNIDKVMVDIAHKQDLLAVKKRLSQLRSSF